MGGEEFDVEILQTANRGDLIRLIRVKTVEVGPEELAPLRQEVSQAHVTGDVASIGLEVVVKSVDVVSNRLRTIQIHPCVPNHVVVDKVNDPKPLKVLKLEESEEKVLDSILS